MTPRPGPLMPGSQTSEASDATEADSALDRLRSQCAAEWPNIVAARSAARDQTGKLRDLVSHLRPPSNTSVVGYGSLAREEWTGASHVDRTLMIDGPSDINHWDCAKKIESELRSASYVEPGRTGTFGSMSSSHELIHHIGGTEDTNINLTRRVLLLLESVSLSDSVTHERVIRAILERYILSDPPATASPKFRVPLFLLNDVVRLWRTFAVDYANKKWNRSNDKWALRNLKLRMSRKLLFAKGLLICLLCSERLAGAPTSSDPELVQVELLDRCFALCRKTALELLAETLLKFAERETAVLIFDAYDAFLGTLNEPEKRRRLETLAFEQSGDALFMEQREKTRSFRGGLEKLFFGSN